MKGGIIISKLFIIEVIIGSIFIFLMGFILHDMYDLLEHNYFSSIFPVNESVWEHTKLFLLGSIIYGLIQSVFIEELPNNFWFAKITSFLVSSIFTVLMYFFITDVFFNGKHNLVVTIIIFLLAIIIGQYKSYQLLTKETSFPNIKEISIVLLIMIFLSYFYLTYNPIESRLFLDESVNR
ncbi:DUF6512 family protein [Mycoplasmatota bacterium zrk1]